jgi:tRNA A37 threonylcarbamoyladenosine modification protein TsaB
MLTALNLPNLRNAEFLEFGTLFSGLVVANNPVVLNVAAQNSAFKSKLDEMAGLFKLEKVSPATQELVLLDERRDRAMNGLVALINGYCYHYDAATLQAANLLTENLNLYGVGIARLNTQAETSVLNGILNDWEGQPRLATAIATLGLSNWAAELKTANQLFEQKYLQRTQEYGAANPVTLRKKREETYITYYELRKFIEANSVINPSAAIEKLISELNALIDQYNELLGNRSAAPAPEPEPAK